MTASSRPASSFAERLDAYSQLVVTLGSDRAEGAASIAGVTRPRGWKMPPPPRERLGPWEPWQGGTATWDRWSLALWAILPNTVGGKFRVVRFFPGEQPRLVDRDVTRAQGERLAAGRPSGEPVSRTDPVDRDLFTGARAWPWPALLELLAELRDLGSLETSALSGRCAHTERGDTAFGPLEARLVLRRGAMAQVRLSTVVGELTLETWDDLVPAHQGILMVRTLLLAASLAPPRGATFFRANRQESPLKAPIPVGPWMRVPWHALLERTPVQFGWRPC